MNSFHVLMHAASAPGPRSHATCVRWTSHRRESRKGLSGGLTGARYEYLKPCPEDDAALDVKEE